MRPSAVSAVACVAMAAGFALGRLRTETRVVPSLPTPPVPPAEAPAETPTAIPGVPVDRRAEGAATQMELMVRARALVEADQAKRRAELRLPFDDVPADPAPVPPTLHPDWGDPRLWPTPRTPETLARAAELAAEGKTALAAGRLDDAEAAFRAALDLDAFNADAIIGLAKILAAREKAESR